MRINPKLIERLKSALGLSDRQVYRLISKKVNETHLPLHLAAIALASDRGINITRFASDEDLADIRQSAIRNAPAPQPQVPLKSGKAGVKSAHSPTQRKQKGTHVFVVHGRDDKLTRSLFSFLRSIGLRPIEWRKAIELTGKPSPYVGDVIDAAFRKATAILVLFTPDDEARLKQSLLKPNDQPYEKELKGQPRPNVLFESGIAFGSHPDSTVLIQVGSIRPFSDIAGRHIVQLSNSIEKRQELITKLRNCGCEVDDSGSDWATEGDFGTS